MTKSKSWLFFTVCGLAALLGPVQGQSPRTSTVMPGLIDAHKVAGDPLTDIGEMRKVIFVMKGGVVYKGAAK